LFVLTGPSGVGKTAILHSVAEVFDERGRLGAGIFLNELSEGKKTADSLMQTLVYYLALSNTRLGKRIALEIARHPSLDSANAARYGELLEHISNDLVLYGPLVIIVDGLHELETQQDQELVQRLLDHLAKATHQKLRFLMSLRMSPQSSSQGSITSWRVDLIKPAIGKSIVYLPESLPKSYAQVFCNEIAVDIADTVTLAITQHSFGSSEWLSRVDDILGSEVPHFAKTIFLNLLSLPSFSISAADAIGRLSTAVGNALPILDLVTVIDFFNMAPGSRVFIQSQSAWSFSSWKQKPGFARAQFLDEQLHNPKIFVKSHASRVAGFDEYNINVSPIISKVVSFTNPPLVGSIQYKNYPVLTLYSYQSQLLLSTSIKSASERLLQQ